MANRAILFIVFSAALAACPNPDSQTRDSASPPAAKAKKGRPAIPEGTASRTLPGDVAISLSVEPATIVWTNIAGQPTGVKPLISYSVTNRSERDLTFDFPTSGQVCFSITEADSGREAWSHPEITAQVLTQRILKPGETFAQTMDLPPAAALPGKTYHLTGSLCGKKEYELAVSFTVAVS